MVALAAPAPPSVGADSGTPGINPPDFREGDKSLKPRRRAIGDVEQAYRICENMFNPSSQRNAMNGHIAKKYNDAPPFDAKKLEQQGEDWRHNFSTGFLSNFVNRVVPIPVQVIDQAQYLSSAKLSEAEDPGGTISTKFQFELTKLVRSWKGWRPMIYALAQEDVLYGYAISVCLDKFEWRPRVFRQDEFGVPDGTGQFADDAQFLALKQSFLIHELAKLIRNEGAAGKFWKLPNAIAAINKAMPEPDRNRLDANNPRALIDLVREGNVGASYEQNASTIDCYHFFATEGDGKVSHMLINRYPPTMVTSGEPGDNPKLLFSREDQFESMSELCTLFSLEPGNLKLHGSKGLGRKLINLHMACERARVRMCDQHYLASTMVIQGNRGVPDVKFKVRHPITAVGSEGVLQANALPADAKPFLELDERLNAYAESIVGDYMPEKLGEGASRDMTAREAMIRAGKEQAQKVAYLQRFFGQFGDMMTMITKRACDPKTTDPDARKFQDALQRHGIARELIDKLSKMPASEVVHDIAQMRNEQTARVCAEFRGDPLINQVKLRERMITAAADPELAQELIIPNATDPTVEAENIWTQLAENVLISSGAPGMPVSPRHKHDTHLKVLADELKRSEEGLAKNPHPKILDNFNAALRHGEAHIKMWSAQAKAARDKGAIQQIRQYEMMLKEAEKRFTQFAEEIRRMKMAQQEQGAQAQPQLPISPMPNMLGAPAGGPEQGGGGPNGEEPERLWGGMTERLITAWIGQYEKLGETEKKNLETMSGLRDFKRQPGSTTETPNDGLTPTTQSATTPQPVAAGPA